MRAGGGRRRTAFRRTRDPQEWNDQHEEDRGGVEQIERREGEGLLVHQPIEVSVALLGLQAEALEELERRAGSGIARREVLDELRVVQGRPVLPQRRRGRGGEGAGGDAQEVVEPGGGGDLLGAQPAEREVDERYEEARDRRALQDRRQDERPDVDLRVEA